jgi:hypothetical protein
LKQKDVKNEESNMQKMRVWKSSNCPVPYAIHGRLLSLPKYEVIMSLLTATVGSRASDA